MVPEECGREMLHGVERAGVGGRFAVGTGQADVECGYHVAGGCHVAPGMKDARLEAFVVDCEACYLFHLMLFYLEFTNFPATIQLPSFDRPPAWGGSLPGVRH